MSSGHPHIAQRKQRYQLRRILCQPFVANLGEAKLTLDHSERVLNLRANAGFELLGFVQQAAPRQVLIQRPAFAGARGDMPVNTGGFRPLDRALVTDIRKHHSFFTVQQSVTLRDIVDIGRSADDGVHQAKVCIDADMRLHAEVPLVAFLGLVRLRILLTRAVLRRAGSSNQRGINDRAGLEHQAFGDLGGVDYGQQLNAQVVLFQKMAKPQDGGFVGQPGHASVKPYKFAVQRRVMQGFFHGRVRQTEPLLHEVNAQHGRYRKGRASYLAGRRMRLNQRNQFGPGHHQVHLVEKFALACSLRCEFKSGCKAHLFHVSTASDLAYSRLTYADLP